MDIIQLFEDEVIDTIINIIKKEFEKNKNKYKTVELFNFPNELSEDIIALAKDLKKRFMNNSNNEHLKKEFESLSDKITDFIFKIKISSYENIMFKEIMESVIKLENYNQRKNNENKKIKTNDSLSENPCSFEEGKIKNNNGTNSTLFYNGCKDGSSNGQPISFDANVSDIPNDYSKNVNFIDEKFNTQLPPEYSEIKKKYNNVSYYANELVKNKTFNKQPSYIIELSFKECLSLYDFKKIQEDIIDKKLTIDKDKLDFNYNFIIPDLSIKYPPYGWFGFGLNVKNIYKNINDNKEKTVVYYGFNNMNSKEIKKMVSNIIKGKVPFINKDLQQKDKGNKVENILDLSPNINIIEQNTGRVAFKDKVYKIALMARVLKDKIIQKDNNYFILSQNEIEFTTIIFKEIF